MRYDAPTVMHDELWYPGRHGGLTDIHNAQHPYPNALKPNAPSYGLLYDEFYGDTIATLGQI